VFNLELFEHNSSDNKIMEDLREKLHHLIHQEVEFEKFKKNYNEVVESDILKNIVEKKKSNYYFNFVENKKDINVKLNDILSPNNKYKPKFHGNPHDHIHPQHYLSDPEKADAEKWKYLAFWDIYLDNFVRNVRPSSLEDEAFRYVKQKPEVSQENHIKNNMYFDYLFTMDNEFYKKFMEDAGRITNKPEEHDDKNRPVGKHWKENHKFPHVADRIGWEKLQEHPVDKNPIFERVDSVPLYQFQPFVQVPSYEPNKDVKLNLF
jgi:hypothetical protein